MNQVTGITPITRAKPRTTATVEEAETKAGATRPSTTTRRTAADTRRT